MKHENIVWNSNDVELFESNDTDDVLIQVLFAFVSTLNFFSQIETSQISCLLNISHAISYFNYLYRLYI